MSDVWTKSRRAMSDEDYETWVRGGVSPTLNAFDNATETRATVLVSFDTQFGSNANVFEEVSPTLKATQAPPSICPGVRRLSTPDWWAAIG